ncbi:S8 family peptidase [Saccharothrix algeriensis]|uniref:Subtilisin family serine protease n=1 Tax=Saccharothrix algeriensis TaxID=173560 RepID=A0ABS2SD41_9PSEU|nr:S8 family peptidase [Saccharothrix algeriensis]MBM7814167.1 subtilisin family serine protease [Saccharothrix algeriensis]
MRHDRSTRRRVATACLATSALMLTGVGYGYAAAPEDVAGIRGANEPGTVKDAYIVVLKDSAVDAQRTPDKASELARRYGGRLKLTYTTALRGFSVSLSEAQARKLAADPAVDYVEQDGIARATGTQDNPTWGLDRVDQKNLPLDRKYTYANTAPNVTAYVIDTGIHKAHGDFGGRASDGYDFIDNDSVAQDCNGHGTHVAGTIGSNTYGVAKGVKLVGVRVLNCQGSGEWSQVIGGIDWVAKNAVKPAVANMSLGGGADSSVDNAVKRAIASGVTFAVASGNDNRDACGTSPARTPEAITVNATDSSDNRSTFSNYGSCTDIFAPGTSITSTWHNGGTNSISGTSMATPHVAGAAALYLSDKTTATPAEVAKALTDNATAGVVKNAGANSPNRLLYTGFIGGGGPEPCAGGSNADDVAIPDAGSAVTSSVSVSGCEGAGSAKTSVKVDINHSYTGDLAIDLVGPSGASFVLRKAGGVGSAGGVHETFTVDTSSEKSRNGTWKLRVTDVYSYDTGNIDGWSLSF